MTEVTQQIDAIIANANEIKRIINKNLTRLNLPDIVNSLEDIVDSLDYLEFDVVSKSKNVL